MDKLLEVLRKVKGMLPPEAQVAIAGGAVRDTLLGIPYKDIDVIVLPNGIEDHLEVIIDCLCIDLPNAELHGFRESYEDPLGTMESKSDFDQRLHGCISFEIDGEEVDLLFQKGSDSFEEVVQGYDHVANMVYLTEEGYKLGTNLPFVRAMLSIGGFNTLRIPRPSRIAKMRSLMFLHGDGIAAYLEEIGGKDAS